MAAAPVNPRNRRLSLRRPAKRSSKATCRKGIMGLGPNLALFLLDLCDVGARLVVKTALKKGEEVEITLLPPGGHRQTTRKGSVAWCAPTTDDQFVVGIQFEKRLEYPVLLDVSYLPAP